MIKEEYHISCKEGDKPFYCRTEPVIGSLTTSGKSYNQVVCSDGRIIIVYSPDGKWSTKIKKDSANEHIRKQLLIDSRIVLSIMRKENVCDIDKITRYLSHILEMPPTDENFPDVKCFQSLNLEFIPHNSYYSISNGKSGTEEFVDITYTNKWDMIQTSYLKTRSKIENKCTNVLETAMEKLI
jgi:hypothetical protein